MTENIFLALAWGGAIFSLGLAFITLFWPKERVAVHAVIISIILILSKIILIVASLIAEINVIVRIMVISTSIPLMIFWGYILYLIILQLPKLNREKKD